jgi:tetratricopeptide (TPR) repeat protein
MRGPAALTLVLALAIPGLASASGTRGLTRNDSPPRTPEQQAVEYLNDGISYRDKADKLEKEALAEKDPAKKAKLLEKSKSQHEASIKKYDKALVLQPAYTPAIEYRAEAYLGLNRLQEVKTAYMMLFNADRARADELAAAMQRWIEKRQSDSAGVDPTTLDDFMKWVAERKQLSSQTSSLTDKTAPRW